MKRNTNLRIIFNNDAELYHAVRPRYPKELFDVLVQIAQPQDNARLLEIGPGTGQATQLLAERGYMITAVELGADLARVARKVLNIYNNVRIITGAFEDTEFPPESFDLVYAATAFHWVKPEMKFTKTHKLLKSGGYLAIINTNHVSDEMGDDFFFASRPIYKKYKPADSYDDAFRLNRVAELRPDKLDEKLFTQIVFGTFPLAIQYSAKGYAQLLSTYSSVHIIEPGKRVQFLEDITKLIEDRFDNNFVRHFGFTLTIGKKKN